MEDILFTIAMVAYAVMLAIIRYIVPILLLLAGVMLIKLAPIKKRYGVVVVIVACLVAIAITIWKFVLN